MGRAIPLWDSQQGGARLGLGKHAGRQEHLGGHGGWDPLGGDDLNATGEMYYFSVLPEMKDDLHY